MLNIRVRLPSPLDSIRILYVRRELSEVVQLMYFQIFNILLDPEVIDPFLFGSYRIDFPLEPDGYATLLPVRLLFALCYYFLLFMNFRIPKIMPQTNKVRYLTLPVQFIMHKVCL